MNKAPYPRWQVLDTDAVGRARGPKDDIITLSAARTPGGGIKKVGEVLVLKDSPQLIRAPYFLNSDLFSP